MRRAGHRDYDPVPSFRQSTSFDLDRANPESRHRALTRIADTMAHPPDGFDAYFLDDLYALMANGFDDLSVQVLRELFKREGRFGVSAVLHLLREAPSRVVFDRTDLLDQLLTAASQVGTDELQLVQIALNHLAWSPPKYVPGQAGPLPTVAARDQAYQAAVAHADGSLMRMFYENLVEASERQIEFERRLHEGRIY
jgi:hypothetical protein